MTVKQTWVIRYLRIDSEHRKLPLSFHVTVEASAEGEGKHLAFQAFNDFINLTGQTILFLDSDLIATISLPDSTE